MRYVPVHSGMRLGVLGVSWVGEAIQEMVRRNWPLCMRNRIFPNYVQALICFWCMFDSVYVQLKDIDSKEGFILDSRIG